jgi:beta-N-acetylhexosaminidase
MKQLSLSLEEKVAQLFVVGSDHSQLAEELEPFYRYGIGGLILFRHHLQPFETAPELQAFLKNEIKTFQGAGVSFLGIDQEGGQIERLPHWLFPTGILPIAYGLGQNLALCEQVNREVSQRLRWLGFNVNFTPTLDLNRETMNPIIGARAYGEHSEEILPFARAVIKAHQRAGVLPVAKHFPGHGSGTVDSHLDLPVFEAWQEEELKPYETLIAEGLPAIMVAHGLYPQLLKQLGGDTQVPASLSKAVISELLRGRLHFNGLVWTDDLMMNAVWQDADPAETALKALEAGADLLVYRRAQPEALQAFEAVVSNVRHGKLPESWIDAKVQRVLETKASLNRSPVYDYTEETLSPEACEALSLQWAQTALLEFHHDFVSPLPLSHRSTWGLVAPDRQTMPHYQPDATHGKDLMGWCQYYGIQPQSAYFYPVNGEIAFPRENFDNQKFETLVFIEFNSHLYPDQARLYEDLKARYPATKMILASCGFPASRDRLSKPWIHVQMPSFRPAAMQAFMQWLITSPRH